MSIPSAPGLTEHLIKGRLGGVRLRVLSFTDQQARNDGTRTLEINWVREKFKQHPYTAIGCPDDQEVWVKYRWWVAGKFINAGKIQALHKNESEIDVKLAPTIVAIAGHVVNLHHPWSGPRHSYIRNLLWKVCTDSKDEGWQESWEEMIPDPARRSELVKAISEEFPYGEWSQQ